MSTDGADRPSDADAQCECDESCVCEELGVLRAVRRAAIAAVHTPGCVAHGGYEDPVKRHPNQAGNILRDALDAAERVAPTGGDL